MKQVLSKAVSISPNRNPVTFLVKTSILFHPLDEVGPKHSRILALAPYAHLLAATWRLAILRKFLAWIQARPADEPPGVADEHSHCVQFQWCLVRHAHAFRIAFASL